MWQQFYLPPHPLEKSHFTPKKRLCPISAAHHCILSENFQTSYINSRIIQQKGTGCAICSTGLEFWCFFPKNMVECGGGFVWGQKVLSGPGARFRARGLGSGTGAQFEIPSWSHPGLAWRGLWNFIVDQVKFNRFLLPNERTQRIFWYLLRRVEWE